MVTAEIPDTFGERMTKYKESLPQLPNADDSVWYDRTSNEKSKKELCWSSPYDARFPQTRKQRKCFNYYVDYFRCKELMSEDYKPCKFFQNVYRDICPNAWIAKWDDWRSDGRFPAKFNR